jgi:hypothetical protein
MWIGTVGGPAFERFLNSRVADPLPNFEGRRVWFFLSVFATQLMGSARIKPCFRFE